MSATILLSPQVDANPRQLTLSPFPGLRPFEPEESELFFGREDDIQDILDRLRRTRFLAVVGSSGCGKSSVVRAGVVASLQDGFMADADAPWRIAIMRPGANPIAQLAAALCRPGALPGAEAYCEGEDVAMTQATLRRGARGLIEEVEAARLPPNSKLLLLVDQFEELFRFTQMEAEAPAPAKAPGTKAPSAKAEAEGVGAGALDAAEEARAFVKLLLAASAEPSAQVYVVLTMRSEFLGYCALLPGLPDAINSGLYLLPQMSRDQFREAIVEPVRVAGGRISPRLVNRMLNDLGDGTDQLPVLQHALMRLWEVGRHTPPDGQIDLEHYEAVGGLNGSISKHAEETFEELSAGQKATAEKLFRLITDTTPDNQKIRRPLKLGRLATLARVGEADLVAVIEKFREEGRCFLMPPRPEPLTPSHMIDISHESLIRQWGRLKEWAEAEMRETRVYRRLIENARAWDEEGRNSAGLYTGSRLVEAEEWAAAHPDRLGQTERDFMRVGRRRANLRRNLTFILLGLLCVGAWGLSAYALRQRNDALRRRGDALGALDIAKQSIKIADEASKRADEQKQLLKTAYAALFSGFGGMGSSSMPPEEFDRRMEESLAANVALQEIRTSEADASRRASMEIRVFIKGKAEEKAVEADIIEGALKKKGFDGLTLVPSNARSAPINSVWADTREVDIDDAKAVAYTFLRAGFQLSYIGPYPDGLKTRRRAPTIRVGGDPDIITGRYGTTCRPLTVREIRDAATFPLCIAP